MTDSRRGELLPKEQRRRSSLRLRVVVAIVFVALAPQLLVFIWSQLDRNVPGRMWTGARDAAEEATKSVSATAGVDEARLGQIARTRRVHLRVLDLDGHSLFDQDADRPEGPFDRVETFFLGAAGPVTLADVDLDLGPMIPRPEVQEAKRAGAYVGCEYVPLVFCQAIRLARSKGGEARLVHVQLSSRRAVHEVYGLRQHLLRLSIVTVPLALILALYTGSRVVRPIERLRRQALEQAEAASPGAILDPERKDEVGVLADAFNTLLLTLDKKREDNEAFVADLVHEMKNPVAAMRAAAESLGGGAVDRERAERLARVLSDSTAKLDRLVTQFLELARAEAGMPNEERSLVDLGRLLAGLVDRMRDDARHSAVQFAIEPARDSALPEALVVNGVEHRLEALFRELLENAASFASTGGRVSVTLSADTAVITVAVADTGPGILPEDRPRVFARFFTTRGRERGTGLGLALVQAVAQAHGGSVVVRGGEGTGATFEVRLPRGSLR